MATTTSERVCVTGANGFVASHVVKQLLEKGYHVVGTVRDPSNDAKVGHLKTLDGAAERLTLVAADLLAPNAFDDIVKDCTVVFHTASPFFYKTDDPEKDLVAPALEGTLSVLRSVEKAGHKPRVVLTSSVAAMTVKTGVEPDHVYDEEDWSDADFCRSHNIWYPLSKTLAERAAWDFHTGLDADKRFGLVTINPVRVIGRKLQAGLNTSCADVLSFMDGSLTEIPNATYSWVDVEDVAAMHVAAAERKEVTGRFLALGSVPNKTDIAAGLREVAPEYGDKIPTKVAEGDAPSKQLFSTKRAQELLGVTFTPLKESLRRTVEGLKAHKHLL